MAQLGARFHGMEEVDGSNPSRSTKFLKHLAPFPSKNPFVGVQMESKYGRQLWDSEHQSPDIPRFLELLPAFSPAINAGQRHF